MLTLFSHLNLSLIDELPTGRKPVTTWLVSNQKKQDSLEWLGKTLTETNGQALIVCPFIEPSNFETLGNITAASDLFLELERYYRQTFPKLKLGLLHGKLKNVEKQRVINQTFDQTIDVLVTTPVVEVGVDLPAANIIIIEAAQRFGLASLHQLRGRVGRAGQKSFCLLFTSAQDTLSHKRLLNFTQEHNGLKLAEQDLQHRGAGDLFGFRQHGFGDLKFASWANLHLIQDAHQAFQQLQPKAWQPLIEYHSTQETTAPAAN
jgi:ATP-dependent DNA helicase RecG